MLLSYLKLLSDLRQQGKVKYELAYIVLFSIIAICCNGYSLEHIATFIEVNFELLKERFDLTWESPPGYTTIRKILLVVDGSELETVFEMYVADRYADEIAKIKRVDLDGKYICGSVDYAAGIPALQLISAYAPEYGLILGHGTIVGQKTNEIPIVQELIPSLSLRGIVFGADALHAQHETLAIIKQTGNEALIQVKDNQSTLLKGMQRAANTVKHPQRAISIGERNKGRIEDRECFVYDHFLVFDTLLDESWPQIDEFVQIKREVWRKDYQTQTVQQSGESSFYLSTETHSADWYLRETRMHWAIENSEHYVRDVSFMEDSCKIKKKPEIMTIFRSLAFNTITHMKLPPQRKKKKKSTKQKLYTNALKTIQIISYLDS